MTRGLHCRVLLETWCAPPSPSSHVISDTFIWGSGSWGDRLGVPLECSLVLAGRCHLCAQSPTGALFPVFPSPAQLLLPSPTGWRETIEKKSLVSISEVPVAGREPGVPSLVRASDSYPQTPAPAAQGRQSCPKNSRRGVQPSFFPAGEGFWGAVSRVDPFGRIRANILQKWDLDIFEH